MAQSEQRLANTFAARYGTEEWDPALEMLRSMMQDYSSLPGDGDEHETRFGKEG
jgi:hypothetical protein